eukprot:26836-Eustigmatos_ZCMA.PRE.1
MADTDDDQNDQYYKDLLNRVDSTIAQTHEAAKPLASLLTMHGDSHMISDALLRLPEALCEQRVHKLVSCEMDPSMYMGNA